MKLPKKDTVFPEPKSGTKKISENFEARDYTTAEMVKRFTFWRFFLFSITLAAIGNTVISLAKDLALSVGASAALATTLVGVLSICNGLGRLVSGALFDTIGRKRTMITGNIITIAAPSVTLFAVLSGSLPLCIAGLSLTGISYGFAPPISSAFTMAFYGHKNFAMNFSIANTMLIPASFTATLAGTMITSSGSYVSTFVMLIAFSAASLLLNLSIQRP
jgi:OFA family oxalate/formate antiporter-like MFS transporter